MRWSVLIAGLLGAVGVAIGAFAAHGLEANLKEQGVAPEEILKRVEQCEIGVRYHMIHVLALLTLGFTEADRFSGARRTTIANVFFLLGIALFSGGLYSMVFLGRMGRWDWDWAIVPSGGLCFILGWIAVCSLAWRGRARKAAE